jgi:hypothetical protein
LVGSHLRGEAQGSKGCGGRDALSQMCALAERIRLVDLDERPREVLQALDGLAVAPCAEDERGGLDHSVPSGAVPSAARALLSPARL